MSTGNPARPLSGFVAPIPEEPENPWLGLASYTELDCSRFFGRDREIAEVLRLIEREALTVVFGRSGLGKTSLLRAGVIPQLQESAYFPIALRLDYSGQNMSPVEQMKAIAREAAHTAGLQLENDLQDKPDATLWEFFHTAEFWSPRNDQLTPILFVDQFEEVFTIGRNVRVAGEFLEQLADLIENRIPRVVQERVERSGNPLTIDAGSRNYKVVLSLREDFVSKLDSLRSSMPAIMRNRFALNPLSGERALSVIVQAGGRWVTEEVARDIVAAVAGGADSSELSPEFAAQAEIEPAYLSVMCHELFQRMVALGRSSITRDLVRQEHGGILEGLYERSFEGLDGRTRRFVEDRLLTASGFRAAVPVAEALHEGMAVKDLDTLVDRRLLRFEDRLGVTHVELSHDLLTGVVLRSRDQRYAREAQEDEARRQAELRRSFRSKAIAALSIAAVAIVVLGALMVWAMLERNKANQMRESALDSNRALKQEQIQLEKQAKELELQRDRAETEEQEAKIEERKANESSREMKAGQQRTRDLSDTIMRSSDNAILATYQDALKEIDTFHNTTDEGAKKELNSSIWAHRNNLQEELKSVDAILKIESTDESAKSLKLSLLFYIADLESRAYGYDDPKYKALITDAEPLFNEKDPWLQARALYGVAEAAGIMVRKPDPAAAKALMDEVRVKGGALQSRKGLSAETWNSIEDAYAECAELQEDRDPKDAATWFVLAVQAEDNAAATDKENWKYVAHVTKAFADFDVDQQDYEGAIKEYTAAIEALQNKLSPQNGGKPDIDLGTYLIDRGDAEVKASHADAARKDYEAAAALTDKLPDTEDNRYQKQVIEERLGDLELDAKNLKKALEWYRKEKDLALILAKADTHRRSGVVYPYNRVSSTLKTLGDTKGARAELAEEVSNWKDWANSYEESDLQGYIKALIALGEFDFEEKDYPTALKSYDDAADWALYNTIRWPTTPNSTLRVESLYLAAQVYETQKSLDQALKSYQSAKDLSRVLMNKDCAGSLGLFNRVETVGIIESLVALKRANNAQTEARDVMQFVEDKCQSIDKNSSLKDRAALSEFLGNLAWESLRSGEDKLAETAAEKALELDPSQLWIKVNLAHAYLFTGRVSDAENLYTEIKDQLWDGHPLKDDIRNDFKELRSLGQDRPAMDTILASLEDDPKK